MLVFYLIISVLLIIILTARLQVHPFIALLLVALMYGFASGMPADIIIKSVNDGFGKTLGGIGIIIILGIIIGAFLENTGGAYSIAEKILKVIGKDKIPAAMGLMGWFVSIPVFADSGFLLLSPLNKSLSKKAKISLAGSAIALSLGLTASHTMVPPTPGPIAASGILGADLGMVILVGIIISLIALPAAILFATKYAAKTYIDPTPQISDEELKIKSENAPGALKSSLPVLIPIFLIVLSSITKTTEGISITLVKIITFIGEPFVALLIGVLLAFLLPKKLDKEMISTTGWIGKSLSDAASIILITGAGGIFGMVLNNSQIAGVLGNTLAGFNLSIWLPFILAAGIKTAQGSSTVSLITTASIMAPLMTKLGFTDNLEKALVVMAIAAGSIVVSHANDSFFWVVTQMSGMDIKMGYRMQTLGTFVLGTTAAVIVSIAHLILT